MQTAAAYTNVVNENLFSKMSYKADISLFTGVHKIFRLLNEFCGQYEGKINLSHTRIT
jgi:hypothetical protein